MPQHHHDPFPDLLTAVKLVERSLTLLADDLDEIREDQTRDHEALVRAEEQLRVVRETMGTLERVVRGDGTTDGVAQQLQELRRSTVSLRESIAGLSSATAAKETATIQVKGHQAQALATIIAALLGAASGIVSLILSTMRH